MERIELLEPFFRDGILNTNFFNGRLLSAEDLRTEQEAARERASQLGRSVGAGIAAGLRVKGVAVAAPVGDPARAVVRVSAGLGLNRAGQLLSLPAETEVALLRSGDGADADPDAGLFAACQPPTTSSVVAGAGAYVLTVRPASGYAGRAPASGLGGEPLSGPGCGSRYAVEGVRFKLVELNTADNVLVDAEAAKRMSGLAKKNDLASRSLLRNELAHACFGTSRLDRFAAAPFSLEDNPSKSPPVYGALDALYSSEHLDSCDLPLALVRWSQAGIDFVDEWAVRRRVTRAHALNRWSHLADDRRQAEGEAAFQQFQDQLAWLLGASQSPQALAARDHFKYLPAAGFVPLAPSPAAKSSSGFSLKQFFAGLTARAPVFADGARLAPLVRGAAAYAPIDTEGGEFVWLYRVVQNARSRAAGSGAREYVAYASGHVPWIGEARFDLARWDYANYV
jgi:hypothetical protein